MKFYRLSDATFYDCINTIYQFIKPFLDKKKVYFCGICAFNAHICYGNRLKRLAETVLLSTIPYGFEESRQTFMRLDFSKVIGKLVVKNVPTYTRGTLLKIKISEGRL